MIPAKASAKPTRPDVPVRHDRDGLTHCRVCGCTELQA